MYFENRNLTFGAVAVATVTLMLMCSAAQAASDLCGDDVFFSPMRSFEPFNHNGEKILVVAGKFDSGAASRVSGAVRRAGSYDEVWLCSPGGFVSEGKKLGKAFSSAGATVRIPNGFRCVSACTIAFLGGFARIIEPDARYIVHASSAYSGDTFVLKPQNFDCSTAAAQDICNVFLKLFSDPSFHCSSVEQLKDINEKCLLIDPQPQSAKKHRLLLRNTALVYFPQPGRLAKEISRQIVRDEVNSTIDLLRYYREMLLSGQPVRVSGSRYEKLKNAFVPLDVYDDSNRGQDSRSWEDDSKALRSAEFDGRTALWQSILTDSELTAKRQLVEYIKSRGITFGPASSDALKILNAMVVCQIQTECRLSHEEAAAFGIHNVFDAD